MITSKGFSPTRKANSPRHTIQISSRWISLLTEPCLILCGDPGIGKSTVIQQTKDVLKASLGKSGHLILLDFRDLPNESVFARHTFDSTEWQLWRNSTGKLLLVVDGVHEGLVKIPGFVSYLAAQLGREPLERLKLILACRSAEWPVNEGKQLISLWGYGEKSPITNFVRCISAMQNWPPKSGG